MTQLRRLPLAVLPLATFSFAAPAAAATVPFAAGALVEDDLEGPRDLAVAEIDGDKLADIVACSWSAGRVEYLHKVGSTFVGVTVTDAVPTPRTLAVGDLDRDGDSDIVVGQWDVVAGADPEDAEVLWLRNPTRGGGGWTIHAIAQVAEGSVWDVALADADGDGDLDLFYATAIQYGGGGLFWAANPGDPTSAWTARTIDGDGGTLRDLATGDLDEDGDPDVVVANFFPGEVYVYRNDGTPANGGWVEETVTDGLGGACSVAIGDLDRDGDLDVVAAGQSDDDVAWFEKAGTSWTRNDVETSFDDVEQVGLADVDQDGDLDVLGRAWLSGEIAWWDNFTGNGSTWLKRSVATGFETPSALEAADLDLDGDPDFLAASFTGDLISWWRNQTIHRRFVAPAPLTVRSGLADPRAVSIADLNGDDWLDLGYALWDGDGLAACFAFAPDSNTWWSETIDATFDGARAISSADLDGDGDRDVIGAAVAADDVNWYENGGGWDPSWTQHALLSELDGAHRAMPADFDLDGDVDLATAGYDDDELSLLLNADGTGSDWDYFDLWSLNGPFDVKIGDLDRNGRPDIVASAYDADRVNVYLNHFPDAWVVDSVTTTIDGPRGIDLCDVDRDGDLDVVAVERLADAIHWYENDDGDGTVWIEHAVGSGTFDDGAGVRCADLDADGDADVAAAGQAGDAVFVWFNYGNGGTWTRYQMEQAVDSPWDVDVGDLDRDGDLDLAVVAGGTADALLWYENVGGQYSTLAYDEAPSHLLDGARDAIFSVIVSHHGRILDSDAEVFVIFLDLVTPGGAPLTSTQANALIDRIEVFRDDDDGIFEPSVEPLVRTMSTLSLDAAGRQAVPLLGDPDARLSPGESQRFWVAFTATAGAGDATPNPIVARLPAGEVLANDAASDLALVDEPAATVETDLLYFGDLLFADDFETGDCTRWDAWTGY